MEVILKEDVAKLGSRGDVVKVAEGYGRNYLSAAQAGHPGQRGQQGRHRADEGCGGAPLGQGEDAGRGTGQAVRRRLGVVHAQVGRERSAVRIGHVERYRRCADKKGFNIDRRKIQLHEPLKTVGEFTVPVKLHKDVTAHLKVVIEKEAVGGVSSW